MNLDFKRQGQMDIDLCYFYTDTINDFKHLLRDDSLKIVCINSWKYLVDKKLIKIYGYVIMPNHIHLLWRMLQPNGKESPAGSFAKFTAHQFKKIIEANNHVALNEYISCKSDRAFQFWKRDPLAIPISSKEILIQKLDYIHNNPLREKWKLADTPENYRWSSARFYSGKSDEFGILTHFADY